jgi:hypothetical protein
MIPFVSRQLMTALDVVHRRAQSSNLCGLAEQGAEIDTDIPGDEQGMVHSESERVQVLVAGIRIPGSRTLVDTIFVTGGNRIPKDRLAKRN